MSNTNCNLLNCVNAKVAHIEKYLKQGKICFSELNPSPGCAVIGNSENKLCEVHTEELFVSNNTIHFVPVNANGDEVTLRANESGCLIVTDISGTDKVICPDGPFLNKPFQKISENGNDPISVTTFGTTIVRTSPGLTTHSLPNGTFCGQLKRINLDNESTLNNFTTSYVNVTITSPTFGGDEFHLWISNLSTQYKYVLFRWDLTKWVPIDTKGGEFVTPSPPTPPSTP